MASSYDRAFLSLLQLKDSDIRIATLEQCGGAVDRGIHIGGAFSAVIPLVSVFYGGNIELDIENPTAPGQDMFVLSKGHAVAPMASIFADLGYFDKSVLQGSRSYQSILNGHPGPILPGVPVSTGPLGQGVGVAQGFALAGKQGPFFDVYAMAGDGELQEGLIWEAVMYAGYKKLDNLCLLVDANGGQLDTTTHMVVPVEELAAKFEAFGWNAVRVDATQYAPVQGAVSAFKHGLRDGRPTVIVCHTVKGFGGFSSFMNGHKVSIDAALMEQELEQQRRLRKIRLGELDRAFRALDAVGRGRLLGAAERMRLRLETDGGAVTSAFSMGPSRRARRAPERDKALCYDQSALPRLDPEKDYTASGILTASLRVLARDSRVVCVDADLSSTSGLWAGAGYVDVGRALNVGIAEANMMNIGEAWAAMGCNVWVSTFCPFFDWRVLRRICIGYQERLEAMERPDGWLSRGHGLDLTFVATAANFDTKTNGATHMGNDDITVFGELAQLKIIDISCPQQLLGAVRWIAGGNKGLVYLRVMRDASPVLYDHDFAFEYGRGYVLRGSEEDEAVILSSGRQVHESLACAELLEKEGIRAGVVDMPSIDGELLVGLYHSGKVLIAAEQNNGHIYKNMLKCLHQSGCRIDSARIVPVNATGRELKPHYIHSGTYEELTEAYGLSAPLLAARIRKILRQKDQETEEQLCR